MTMIKCLQIFSFCYLVKENLGLSFLSLITISKTIKKKVIHRNQDFREMKIRGS